MAIWGGFNASTLSSSSSFQVLSDMKGLLASANTPSGMSLALVLFAAPALVVLANLFRQLVRAFYLPRFPGSLSSATAHIDLHTTPSSRPCCITLHHTQQFIPRDPSDPPEVFHWIPFVGSAIAYGMDPIAFFFDCRDRVRLLGKGSVSPS